MKNKTAFIVLTCDAYSDLWPMYIYFFEKNWPDCPYDRYFITNHKSIPKSSFGEIKIGDDKSWSDYLIKALEILKKDYSHVLAAFEDWPIIEKVNQNKFVTITDEFFKKNGNFLSFRRITKPSKPEYSELCILEKGLLYRSTCVYSLWKIDVLMNLLKIDESAWDFERYGAIRSDKYDKFYCTYNHFFKLCNTVIKGKWLRWEQRQLKKHGYTQELGLRQCFSFGREIIWKIYSLFFEFMMQYNPFRFLVSRSFVFKVKGYKYKDSEVK